MHQKERMAIEAAKFYERERHLPSLIALWPGQMKDKSKIGTMFIIKELEGLLSGANDQARTGHWCYDPNRHQAIISAFHGEMNSLKEIVTNTD